MLLSPSSSRARLVGWKAISYQNPISQDKRQPIFPRPSGGISKLTYFWIAITNWNRIERPECTRVFFARQHRKKGSSLLSPPLFVLREPNINILTSLSSTTGSGRWAVNLSIVSAASLLDFWLQVFVPHVFANGGGTEEGGMENEGGGADESNSDDDYED